jgi:outer membrane protein OmpA-like peptidoglycan-associated protein
MLNSKKALRPALETLGLLAAIAAPLSSHAAVNVQNYTSAANSTYTLTEDAKLDVAPFDPTWNGSRMFFSANYNWLNDPIIEYNATRDQRLGTVLDSVQTLDLTVGWFLAQQLSVDFSAPINLVHSPGANNQFAFGDSRLFAKWRLTDRNAPVAVSLVPELRLPTGDQNVLLSDGSVSPGMMLAFESDFGPVRAAANVGYRYSANAQYRDINYAHRVPLALGVFAPIGPRWGVNAEVAGAVVMPRDRFNNPGEAYAGLRYQIHRDAALVGGVGLGTVNNDAGNDIRISAGIRFSPSSEAPVVAKAPVATAPIAAIPARRVFFTPKEIRITEEVKFHHASSTLTDSGQSLLDEVAVVMKRNRSGYHKILIAGHTNELGSYPYNQTLSERRAEAVREYLTSRGISAEELLSIGYGKTKPKRVGGLSKDATLAANRRVEFKIIN